MATKPLERLLFAQGGRCFFCAKVLQKDEASVEHLVPSARAGSNADDNCVACCKSLNSLLGSMSLKEKVKVFLNQKGDFHCPNGAAAVAEHGENEEAATPTAQERPVPQADPLPAGDEPAPVTPPAKQASPPARKGKAKPPPGNAVAEVIAHLKGLKKSKPGKVETLTSTIKALPLKLDSQQIQRVIEDLKSQGQIVVKANKVDYKL